MLTGKLALPGQLLAVERTSRRGEETERVVVSTTNIVRPDYGVDARAAQTQRQVVSWGIRLIAHGPLVEAKTIEMGCAGHRAGEQFGDVARRLATFCQKRVAIALRQPTVGAVVFPLAVRAFAFESHSDAGVPAAKFAGGVAVIVKQEVPHRVLFAAGVALQVVAGELVNPCCVCLGQFAPFFFRKEGNRCRVGARVECVGVTHGSNHALFLRIPR